jgi:histidinol dehydrogenase
MRISKTRFAALLSMKREDAPEVDDAVAAIIADVRRARATRRFWS